MMVFCFIRSFLCPHSLYNIQSNILKHKSDYRSHLLKNFRCLSVVLKLIPNSLPYPLQLYMKQLLLPTSLTSFQTTFLQLSMFQPLWLFCFSNISHLFLPKAFVLFPLLLMICFQSFAWLASKYYSDFISNITSLVGPQLIFMQIRTTEEKKKKTCCVVLGWNQRYPYVCICIVCLCGYLFIYYDTSNTIINISIFILYMFIPYMLILIPHSNDSEHS